MAQDVPPPAPTINPADFILAARGPPAPTPPRPQLDEHDLAPWHRLTEWHLVTERFPEEDIFRLTRDGVDASEKSMVQAVGTYFEDATIDLRSQEYNL